MARRSINLTDLLHEYLVANSVREPAVLARLRAETAPMEMAGMQISPEQGQFMRLLVELVGARRVIEVGTFTGYSSLAVALSLPADGRIVACDVNRDWTDIARRYWAEAGVAGKIDLRLAPARDTLDALIAAGEQGRYDFAFIDADKKNYDAYYERCLQLVELLLRERSSMATPSGRHASHAAVISTTVRRRRRGRGRGRGRYGRGVRVGRHDERRRCRARDQAAVQLLVVVMQLRRELLHARR